MASAITVGIGAIAFRPGFFRPAPGEGDNSRHEKGSGQGAFGEGKNFVGKVPGEVGSDRAIRKGLDFLRLWGFSNPAG